MNKFHAVILVGSALFLSGCLNKSQTTTATIGDGQTAAESLSEWQKIGAAIESGKSVKCEMRNTQTQQTGQYYMKGKKVRVDSLDPQNPEASGSFLTDTEYVYTWNETKKEGVKFPVTAPTDQNPESPQATQAPDFSQESAWDEYENLGYTVTCTTESFDESMLTPPTDITFTDMSAFMQNIQSNGSGDNPAMNQEQLEQLMQQYQE
ncbi:MAG: hypothetical protein BroJett025_07770 [Patescibacteria group bacterium]|nr:MAG: hypothetical protein BroJett025_07770 [Patescibacteria group bacterium]